MPIIPKEESASYQRWHIDSFDPPSLAPPRKPPPEPETLPNPDEPPAPMLDGIPLPTAESLAQIHEEARNEGYREGLAAGEAAGYEAGMARARTEAEHLAQLAGNFTQALASLDQNIADAVLDLALTVARQVLQQQLDIRPESILSVIRSALTSLPLHHGTINLLTHPEDARLIREQMGHQLNQSGWHLIEDQTMERGGCLVRAGTSEVDATFATRWRRVLESLGKTNDPNAA